MTSDTPPAPAADDATEAPFPPPTAAESSSARPRESQRIVGLDVARGFALLGIFLVNIDFMSLPVGATELIPEGKGDGLAWLFVEMFCEGKFYPLFSMLFGAGLILQKRNVEGRGAAFTPLYLRRLLFLSGFGLFHGLFLWYGDILFVYSFAGLLLLLASGFAGKTLLQISGLLWFGAVVVMASFAGLASIGSDENPFETSREAALETARNFELPEEILPIFAEGDIESKEWMAAEIGAYRDGPYLRTAGFRAVSFVFVSIITLFAGLDILAMFALGAALVKIGFFEEKGERWRTRLVGLAMLVGLPLSTASAVLPLAVQSYTGAVLSEVFRVVGGPILSLGYLSAALLLAQFGLFEKLLELLAAAGRMALTNYISQSLIGTFVMYSWGLGKFASVNGTERVLLVIVVFSCQLALSRFWLTRFRFGPLEWLWRSLTYWRRQPMLRTR
ncbi:MAG: DUF418 domain-containing protein [Acidobacteriota bacterium]